MPETDNKVYVDNDGTITSIDLACGDSNNGDICPKYKVNYDVILNTNNGSGAKIKATMLYTNPPFQVTFGYLNGGKNYKPGAHKITDYRIVNNKDGGTIYITFDTSLPPLYIALTVFGVICLLLGVYFALKIIKNNA